MKMALNGNDFDRNDQINLKYVCMFDIYFECKKFYNLKQNNLNLNESIKYYSYLYHMI